MSLEDYLNTNANLHAREELLNYRLLFDVKLAAAKIGYHLLTYYSDVDHDGFDVIFDDRHTVRKVVNTGQKVQRFSEAFRRFKSAALITLARRS